MCTPLPGMADGLAGRPTRLSIPTLSLALITALGLTGVTLSRAAFGQVTVNPQAVAPLSSGTSPTPTPPAAKPTPKHNPHPAPVHTAPVHTAAPHTTPVPPTPPRVTPPIVPPIPPPPAVLAPLSPPPPTHPVEAPPPVPIVPDATGTATEIPSGIRVTFGATSADINVITDFALRHLARMSPHGNFTITAFASGVPDDPSTPRRLSLSRALAARSLLMSEGIPSVRINVRALGPNSADGPPDRVDVTVAMPPNEKP